MANPRSPFDITPTVPLVGQPFTMNGGFVTLSVTCNCAAKQPLLLVGFGSLTVCRACRRGVRLLAYAYDPRTGEPPQIHLDIVVPESPTLVKPS